MGFLPLLLLLLLLLPFSHQSALWFQQYFQLLDISPTDPNMFRLLPGEAQEFDILQEFSLGEGGERHMHTGCFTRVGGKAEAALVGPVVHFLGVRILFQGEKRAEERIAGPGVKVGFDHQASWLNQASGPLLPALYAEGGLHLLEAILALLEGLHPSFQKGCLGHKMLV